MALELPIDNLGQISLQELARGFFMWKAFQVRESVLVQGNLQSYRFDFLLSRNSPSTPLQVADIGVKVIDWARTCGVNVILHFEQMLEDVQPAIPQGMVVSNRFSSSARSLATKAGITLLSRGELVSIYRNQQISVNHLSQRERN